MLDVDTSCVDVAGLQDITDQLKKHSGLVGDLSLNLATQRNLWSAIGETIKYRVLGPVGSLTGAFVGLQSGIKTLIRDSGTLEAAWRRMSQIKLYQGQFEALLKSASAARTRLGELAQFSNKRLVSLDESARASRGLEILTRGAKSGADTLNLVADAARASNESLEDAGNAIGGFYRALQDGKPVEAAAGALEGMGLLTRQNVDALSNLQKTGASLPSQFAAFEQALAGNSKQSEKFEDSLAGLQEKATTVREKLSERFGKPFIEGERAGLEKSIQIYQNLEGPVGAVADNLARFTSFGQNAAKTVGVMATRIPGLTFAAGAATKAFTGLVAGATAIGAVQAGRGILALGGRALSAVRNFDSVATASNLLTRAQAARAAAATTTGAEALFHTGRAAALETTAGGVVRGAEFASNIGSKLAGGLEMAGVSVGLTAFLAAAAQAIEYVSKLDEQLKELNQTNAQSEQAIWQQIAAIKSQEDAEQALIATTKNLSASRASLADVKARNSGFFGDSRQIHAQERAVRVAAAQQSAATNRVLQGEPSIAEKALFERRASRQIALSEMERQLKINRATGYEKAALLEADAQQAEANAAEANRYYDEKPRIGRLEEAAAIAPDKQVLFQEGGVTKRGPLKLAVAAARRGSSSEIIRESQRIEDLRAQGASPRDVGEAEARLQARQNFLLNQPEGQAQEKRAAANQALTEAATAQLQIDAEQQINQLKDHGRDRDSEAMRLQIDALQQQRDLLQQIDAQGAAALQNRAQALQREKRLMEEEATLLREMDAARLKAAQANTAASVAAARGHFAEASRQRDLALQTSDAAEEKQRAYELTKSGYTDQEAAAQAANERAAKVQDRAAQAEEFRMRRKREIHEGGLALKGDAQGLTQARDTDAFRDRVKEGLANNLSPQESVQYAYQSGMQEIAAQQRDFAQSHVVDSLQRIGGGGGISSDPGIDIAKRQESLLQQAVASLQQLVQQSSGSGIPNDANVDDGGFY